nr:hypothetical protein [Candidatus Sigynarchaeota archaeon]
IFFSTMAKNIGDIVILPASHSVWKAIHDKLKSPEKQGLIESGRFNGVQITLIKTGVGTPSMANVLEVLKEIKPRAVLRVDYAGSLVEEMPVGSVFIARDVIPGDGTSIQYINEQQASFQDLRGDTAGLGDQVDVDPVYSWLARKGFTGRICADPGLLDIALKSAENKGMKVYAGTIWSTDGLFTESKVKAAFWKSRGAMGVDMETSLLYLLCRLSQIPAIAIHGISDNLAMQKPFYELDHYDPGIEQGIEKVIGLLESMMSQIKQ